MMNETNTIRVVTFGSAAAALGWSERLMPLPDNTLLQHLIESLEATCPRLADARRRMRFAINQKYADLSSPLQQGDEVALIPPVSGG